MKISRNWLQTYFDTPLPDASALDEALTFHAFEIDGVEKVADDDVFDVKVTPNRGHDCLSHRGIGKELSAILKIPLTHDPFTLATRPASFSMSMPITVSIADTSLCPRYIAWSISGVKVGPSPEWLKKSLESIGQRSINNVVDATNFVMFNVGQPLHAFDASKLKNDRGYAIEVRKAKSGEKIMALDTKEYALSDQMLVIVDRNAQAPIGIAGVKGGKAAEVNEQTTNIIIESANFNGASVRKTAQALKLRTDASSRFEQVISPELAGIGMRAVVDLVIQLAGGELAGFADEYPTPHENKPVSVSLSRINNLLGTSLSREEIIDAFTRLGFDLSTEGDTFTVKPPFERLDLAIPEDLVEEVARIVGYDKVPATELPQIEKRPEIDAMFYAAEHAREELMQKGYSEVFTSVFTDKGKRQVLNKVGGEKPFLRDSLKAGLEEALARNARLKDLLGLKEVKLFEIGTIWKGDTEEVVLGTIAEKEKFAEVPLEIGAHSSYEDLPLSSATRSQMFSKYPFIVRDIALWVPKDVAAEQVLDMIKKDAGPYLVRSALFDRFEKGEEVSLAFRLVFQAADKTLTDAEINAVMETIASKLQEHSWKVR